MSKSLDMALEASGKPTIEIGSKDSTQTKTCEV